MADENEAVLGGEEEENESSIQSMPQLEISGIAPALARFLYTPEFLRPLAAEMASFGQAAASAQTDSFNFGTAATATTPPPVSVAPIQSAPPVPPLTALPSAITASRSALAQLPLPPLSCRQCKTIQTPMRCFNSSLIPLCRSL